MPDPLFHSGEKVPADGFCGGHAWPNMVAFECFRKCVLNTSPGLKAIDESITIVALFTLSRGIAELLLDDDGARYKDEWRR